MRTKSKPERTVRVTARSADRSSSRSITLYDTTPVAVIETLERLATGEAEEEGAKGPRGRGSGS